MKLQNTYYFFLVFIFSFIWMGPGACVDEHVIAKNAVKVGLLLPFTGEDAAIGANYEHAALLAQDEINRNGGIDGRPLALITRDTHSTVDGAIEAVQSLKREKVMAVIGPESTEIARVILPELQAAGIILVSPVISGADSIVIQDNTKWFRLSPSASILGRSFANRLWDTGVRELSVVYSSEDYHQDFIGALADRFIKRGGQLKSRVFLHSDKFSYYDEVEELIASDSANVALSASLETGARFVNELTTSGDKTNWNWYFSPVLETPVFPQNTFPGVVEGAQGVGIKVSGFDNDFRQLYLAHWNIEPLDGAYFYYDATVLVSLALERIYTAQSPQPMSSQLQEAIDSVAYRQGVQVKWNQLGQGLSYVRGGSEISYSGLSGTLLFDETGQQQKAPLKYWMFVDGEVQDE